jgi:hypothetical protein
MTRKIKKIILLLLLFIAAYLLWITALKYYNQINHSQEEWDEIRNISDVGFAVSAIKTYTDSKGFMPERLDEILNNDPLPYDWSRLREIITKRQVKYCKDGFEDSLGNKWLVVLKDDKYPNIYFVGKFLHSETIKRRTLVQDPFQ